MVQDHDSGFQLSFKIVLHNSGRIILRISQNCIFNHAFDNNFYLSTLNIRSLEPCMKGVVSYYNHFAVMG